MPDPAPEMERISMMNRLKAKLKKQGGFTLVEMLIVVAIIAILIAVSIPMVGTALEKSRHAVDQANVRDAMALGSILYLDEGDTWTTDTVEYTYAVNAAQQGKLFSGTPDTGYTAVTPECTCNGHATDSLTVTITKADGTVATSWKYDGTKTVDW